MKVSDFRKFIATNECKAKKAEVNLLPSVCDPSFARTGRQIATLDAPFEYKDIYRNGVTAEHMQDFDKMYVDKISGFESAKKLNDMTQQEMREAQKAHEEAQSKEGDK